MAACSMRKFKKVKKRERKKTLSRHFLILDAEHNCHLKITLEKERFSYKTRAL